jgi:hypothetical protein
VKEQNWFAVFLDLAIVVFGVFIGIQVSNWNQSYADNLRGNGYLVRIAENLETDVKNFNNRIEFWQDVSDFGVIALQYTNTQEKSDLSNWEILLAFFQASQIAEFITTKTTYNELTSAGELGLIKNIKIRNVISKYYTDSENGALMERPAYRVHVRGYIPIVVQKYIWRNCYQSDKNSTQVLMPCKSPISEEQSSEILQIINADDELMRELRYWASTLDVTILISQNLQANAHYLLDLIDKELGGEG